MIEKRIDSDLRHSNNLKEVDLINPKAVFFSRQLLFSLGKRTVVNSWRY